MTNTQTSMLVGGRYGGMFPTQRQLLGAAIDRHFEAARSELTESYVHHTDYGWSANQIAANRRLTSSYDFDEIDIACSVCAVELELEEGLSSEQFGRNCKAERVFSFFVFLELEREHREAALRQIPLVWPLLDAELMREVALILGLNQHQLLDLYLHAGQTLQGEDLQGEDLQGENPP